VTDFNNKVIVVTGGGSGIGKAITDQFVSQGATVVVGQRSNSEAGDHCAVDLANSQDCERLIKYTADTYGRIDGLINNAGMMQESAVTELSVEDWNRSQFNGTFFTD
jgi:meso-butanediol dehydrogenase/(S,S)-butanediol dehydrogenase/diacetyl reductase